MPYIPPNTFIAGQTIDPEKWNENTRAIAAHFNEALDGSELVNTTVETKHINRPTLVLTTADTYQMYFESETIMKTNLPSVDTEMYTTATGPAPEKLPGSHMQLANGFIAGTVQPATYYKGNEVNGFTESSVKPINKTGMTVQIPHDAKAINIQYTGEILAPAGYGGRGAVFYIGIRGVPISSTLSYITSIDSVSPIGATRYSFNRRMFTLNYLWKGPSGSGIAGPETIDICLMGGSNQSCAFVGQVSGFAEVLY